MKHKLTTTFVCTILFFTAAVCGQAPSYQHITYIEVPFVEVDVQQTNVLRHVDQKLHKILQDIDAAYAGKNDRLDPQKYISSKYLKDDKCFASYFSPVNRADKWVGPVYSYEVYPLETSPDYFMNYSVQTVPATYNTYSAAFSPSQGIYKVVFQVYSKDQIGTVKTPLDLSILKEKQKNIPTVKKTVYIGLPDPALNTHVQTHIQEQKLKVQELKIRTVHKARSIKRAIIILIVIIFALLFPLVLLIIGIVVASSTIKKEKKEHTRISREVQKINAMTSAGKITPEEADELKRAFGPIAITETSREPDTHITVIGILNIVLPAIQGLLLITLFLGFGFFMAFAGHSSRGSSHGAPIVLFVIILIIALVFLALAIFQMIAGVALMKGRSWARIVIIVFAVLGITSVPIGTALGIYSLWALIFRENAGLYFISDNK